MNSPTSEEKNRQISEWLEPFETLPKPEDAEDAPRCSSGGAWFRDTDVVEFMYRLETHTVGPWKAQQWHTDESASAMLLERMKNPILVVQWVDEHWVIYRRGLFIGSHVDLKTAIRDAFFTHTSSQEPRKKKLDIVTRF